MNLLRVSVAWPNPFVWFALANVSSGERKRAAHFGWTDAGHVRGAFPLSVRLDRLCLCFLVDGVRRVSWCGLSERKWRC